MGLNIETGEGRIYKYLLSIGDWVEGLPLKKLKPMSPKTFKVRKVAIAGAGGNASAREGKLAMWLNTDVLEAIIETGVGHKGDRTEEF